MNPRKRWRPTNQPQLKFSPTAWAKLLYLRDVGDTEVGGFGIASYDDPLFIQDVRLVMQTCTQVTVAFDDAAVADFFDEMVDDGLTPDQFARIWIHTHPGDCPTPSGTDEQTFARVFGECHWCVMFILAQEGQTYARLRFNVGPGGETELSTTVDFSEPFEGSDADGWDDEYARCVTQDVFQIPNRTSKRRFDRDPPSEETEEREQWWREWEAMMADDYEDVQHFVDL